MSYARVDGPGAPVLVQARLETPSRWSWPVTWLLLVPHHLVLLFPGVAFAAVTVVAFFAILVTGRCPAPLFAFDPGVLRWGRRVGSYGCSAARLARSSTPWSPWCASSTPSTSSAPPSSAPSRTPRHSRRPFTWTPRDERTRRAPVDRRGEHRPSRWPYRSVPQLHREPRPGGAGGDRSAVPAAAA